MNVGHTPPRTVCVSLQRVRSGSVQNSHRGAKHRCEVPDAPLPDPETPAPPCFLPESDNALLSHADRTRIISEEYRRTLFKAPIMRGVLLDGFVCGTWKKERTREKATLLIEPFEPLATKERDSLAKEGERLVRFVGKVARRSRSGLPSPREATGLRSGGGAG
jgi:hypothetical protein